MPRTGTVGRRRASLRGDSHRRFHPHRCRHGIVISIPATAENRSRSRWNSCSRSSGIGVHDALETAFTMDRNMQLVARQPKSDFRLPPSDPVRAVGGRS